MAVSVANLTQISNANGYGFYRYDTTDNLGDVDTAGYFNNKDDNLNLSKGDVIIAFTWATAVRTGTLSESKMFVVTNVIANDAAASAGAVNVAEMQTTGTVSSGD